MSSQILRPSFNTGFAKSKQQSKFPALWDGLQCAIIPNLGPQGSHPLNISENPKDFGTLVNMSPNSNWVNSHDGWALSFDGVNEYITVPSSVGLSITKKLTLVFSFQTPTLTGNRGGLMSKSKDTRKFFGNAPDIVFEMAIVNFLFFMQISNGSSVNIVVGNGSELIDNRTHVVAAIWDGTTNFDGLRLYFDSVLRFIKQPTITAIQDLGAQLAIGGFDTLFPLKGKVHFAYVYNRVLSLNELKLLQHIKLAPFQLRDTLSTSPLFEPVTSGQNIVPHITSAFRMLNI